MAKEQPSTQSQVAKTTKEINDDEELLKTLRQETLLDGGVVCLYNGFWCMERLLGSTIRSQKYFKAHDSDIILPTLPKCGTTWLKSLVFSIVNRKIYSIHQTSPLLTTNPHDLVPFLEFQFMDHQTFPDLENIPQPRLFSTHLPYHSIPSSIHQSKSRLIYICRNPLDYFVSSYHFLCVLNKNKTELLSLDEAFDKFCRGIHYVGPFWDHMLGYWEAHLNNPRKVLFLKYEDMKEDVDSHVKKIADFIGLPFSEAEEERGVVQEISKLCSFEHLKGLEANKTTIKIGDRIFSGSSFFRKGQVGDWTNYLTPEMVELFQDVLRQHLDGSGLSFKFH